MVNDYLMKNFQSIMDYKFTSQMEDKLDEISLGKLNWQKTIKVMYDEFNPMVEKLKEQFVTNVSKDRVLLGDDIYKNIGKFGPMIEIKKNNKIKFVSLDSSPYDYETITLKEAKELASYPKVIGKIENNKITLNLGRYGLYVKYNKQTRKVKNPNVSIKDCEKLFV